MSNYQQTLRELGSAEAEKLLKSMSLGPDFSDPRIETKDGVQHLVVKWNNPTICRRKDNPGFSIRS